MRRYDRFAPLGPGTFVSHFPRALPWALTWCAFGTEHMASRPCCTSLPSIVMTNFSTALARSVSRATRTRYASKARTACRLCHAGVPESLSDPENAMTFTHASTSHETLTGSERPRIWPFCVLPGSHPRHPCRRTCAPIKLKPAGDKTFIPGYWRDKYLS